MAVHFLASTEHIGTRTLLPGDYMVYELASSQSTPKPWIVDQVGDCPGDKHNTLGSFNSEANALTFVLAHQSTGREEDGVLCSLARDVIHNCSLPEFADALQRLALAVEVTSACRPRVLVVVEHGIARVHCTQGVDAVVVDLDAARDFPPDDLLPVHTDFTELLKDADVDWPLSSSGRVREPA